ncbi:unnamed protein product [Closterium sp. Yama58-4]|nr:unnamed protein product [Closterium sp. Yama58-4]
MSSHRVSQPIFTISHAMSFAPRHHDDEFRSPLLTSSSRTAHQHKGSPPPSSAPFLASMHEFELRFRTRVASEPAPSWRRLLRRIENNLYSLDEAGTLLFVVTRMTGLLAALAVAAVTALAIILVPGVDVLLRRLKDGRTDEATVLVTGVLAAPVVALVRVALMMDPRENIPHQWYIIFPAWAAFVILGLWSDVCQTQTRAWVGRQGLVAKDELPKLTSAAVSFLEYVISALFNIFGTQEASEEAPIRSRQQEETAALIHAMQARIYALEGQLLETRRELWETRRRLE